MKIKKLTETAIIPTRATDGSAGYDLYADSVHGELSVGDDGSVYAAGGAVIEVHTGIAMAIPEGYVGLIFARSGLACKQGLRPANCVGVIDEDYRGEIIVNLYNDVHYDKIQDTDSLTCNSIINNIASFNLKDRVAQIVFVPYGVFEMELADELDDTVRGDGGFGSTGLQP